MLTKYYETNWIFDAPEAILTCNKVKCNDQTYLVYGGHDRTLYLMNSERNRSIIDQIKFDGWCRCSYTIDLDGDGCDEILVGAGDGSILVLKVNEKDQKLFGIMHYKAKGKIICCTAGDLNEDGTAELIYGGDHNQLFIFNKVTSETPDYTLFYDSWVTTCTIGLLFLKKTSELERVLLVGTKNGDVQLLKFDKDDLKIIWNINLSARINDIKVGDITNDGRNEIIIASDDSYVKILDPDGNRLVYKRIEEGRPLRLLVHDVDGDNSNEIIVGGADGSLKIFQNNSVKSTKLNLKWKKKVKTSIKDICTIKDTEDKINHIIFGGYTREIHNVYDFQYGKKEKLEIIRRSREEELLTDSIVKSKKIYEHPIPTNISEKIKQLLKTRIYLSLDGLKEDLKNFGYSSKKISTEIESFLNNSMITHQKISEEVWRLNETLYDTKVISKKEIDDLKIEETKPESKKEKTPKEKIPKSSTEGKEKKKEIFDESADQENLKTILINFLKTRGIISSKNEIVEKISEKGFKKSFVESEIEVLKESNVIEYSRSKPRGWQLSVQESLETEDILELKKETTQEDSKIENSILKVLKKEGTISSKSNLIEKISALGYKKDSVENQIDKLNDQNKISYSRSKPRGWRLVK